MIQVTPEHFLSLLLAGLTTGDEHMVSCPGPWVIESLKESFIFKKKSAGGVLDMSWVEGRLSTALISSIIT